jgi:hypothetical protein
VFRPLSNYANYVRKVPRSDSLPISILPVAYTITVLFYFLVSLIT